MYTKEEQIKLRSYLAVKIKEFCKANNISLRQFGIKIGIKQSRVASYVELRAFPSHSILPKILKLLNITYEQMIKESENNVTNGISNN